MTAPTRQLRRARVAVATCFALNAVFYTNLVPRLPELRDDLGLSNGALGAALAAAPLGALLMGPAAAVLIARLGSGPVASIGLTGLGAGVAVAAAAPNWPVLAAALFLVGALDTVVDVAQNAHGLRVQRGYGRSILNALHGLWSLGAVAGGLLGSLVAGLGVPRELHLVVSAVVFGAVALLVRAWMLPGRDGADVVAGTGATAPAPRRARRTALVALAALGVLAAAGAFVEDAAASWSAIWLRDDLGAGVLAAGLGFVVFQVAMTAGRLTGDRVVDRFGQRRVARVGGAVIAAGFAVMLAAPSLPTTLVGFALAGVGVATLVPAVYAAADEVPGLPTGVGLTAVNLLLRLGFLVSPPLIGVVSDAVGLRVGLGFVVLAGVLVVGLGRVLRTRVG
ncbi:MFS transporter [Klenkia sp. LSe6-5]|uniref:MFS transporter n=1 Tax=Klenkia sesuvii TaxID=3103137 RepID=A0ABU8DPL7_9ACTN